MGAILDFGYVVPNPLDATILPSLVGRRATSPYAPAYYLPPQQAADEAPEITSKLPSVGQLDEMVTPGAGPGDRLDTSDNLASDDWQRRSAVAQYCSTATP